MNKEDPPTLSLHRSFLCLCLPKATFECFVKEEMYLKVIFLLLSRCGKPAQGQSLFDTHRQHPRKVRAESVDVRRQVGGQVETPDEIILVWAASGRGQVPVFPR